MAITAYNPTYRDDINIPDTNGKTPLDKNYLRVLFKPGVSVQTRELNQIQSTIQAQLDRVGESIFRSGKPVLGGIAQFDDTTKIYSVDVTLAPSSTITALTLPHTLISSYYADADSNNLTASIVSSVKLSDKNYRLYVKSKDSQVVNSINKFKFASGDSVTLSYDDGSVNATVSATGIAVGAHIAKGVYFTKGSYVVVDEQYVATDVEYPSTKFTGYVVLKIDEYTVSATGEGGDETLLDNAAGFLNYAAPGADRYAIDLTLSLTTSVPSDNDYITLLTVRNDVIITDNSAAAFSGIDDKLAQRTYEESGNYEVNPFPLHILEAYNDGTASGTGMYLENELVQNGYYISSSGEKLPDIAAAKNDLVVKLDPSVAYVKGYRVELKNSLPLTLPKARSTSALQPSSVSANMGMYVDGTFDAGSDIFDIQKIGTVYHLYDGDTPIGTAKIRSIEYIGGSTYRVFLYDVKMTGAATINSDASIGHDGDDFIFYINTVLKDTNVSQSLFQLPLSPVNTIEDVVFSKKNDFVATAVEGGRVVINIDSEKSFDKSLTNILVRNETTGAILDSSVIVLDSTASNVLSFTAPSLIGPDLIESGDNVKVITTVTSKGERGTKTLRTKSVPLSTLTADPETGVYTLTDTYHLVSIVDGTGPNATLASDYTVVNDGQYDTHYAEATFKYNVSGSVGTKQITYTYFDFGNTTADFFDATSYFYESDTGASVQMALEDIPYYKTTALYDVLDFRYYRIDDPTTVANPIDPYSAITFNASYYLPRIDTVSVSQAGNFFVNKGIPSRNPQKPKSSDSAMELYVLTVAPYTFGPDDVIVEKVDNQRYTMSNIRGIDKRVSNLEYYTTLSLLEKSAKDTLLYTDGVERFKNGFVVDNFAGHNVGDPANPDYICSIDAENNELRPAFSINSLKLTAVDTSGVELDGYNSGVHERSITLPYKTVPYISQTLGTDHESVNPYDVATFVGNLKMYPSSDYWCDSKQRPNLVIKDNTLKDAIRNFAEDLETELKDEGLDVQILGTEWGSWETYWKGKPKVTRLFKKGKRKWYGKKKTVSIYQVEREIKQSREGINTSVGSANSTELDLGDRVVDVSVRPYIRQRYVYFEAHSLKPNTVYYPFFDGTNVSAYCIAKTATTIDKQSDVVSVNGEPLPIPTSDGSPLKSDASGNLYGLFVIPDPEKTGLKFVTGTRQFRLTDSASNIPTEATSYADANYVASGMVTSTEKAILSTAIPELVRTDVKDNRSVTDTRIVISKKTCWLDPIAQSFLISNPEGIFATGIDLYFASVPSVPLAGSSIAPVEIFIVTCENGIPTQKVVPLTTVSKNADEVTAHPQGTRETYFEFDQPVYLAPGQEYAVVCTSVDSNYRVYTATLGANDVATNQLVSANPYNGVFFKSQNSSTWSPDQSKDLKFRLHRAAFSTNETNVKFRTVGTTRVQSIKITNPGSGYITAPTVTISGGNPTSGYEAVATAILSPNTNVSEIILETVMVNGRAIQGGQGYQGKPTITISAPTGQNGIQATAEAVMYNVGVSSFVLDQDTVEISAVDEQNPSRTIQSTVSNLVTVLGESYDVEANVTYDSEYNKKSWLSDGVNNNNPVEVNTTLKTTSDYLSPVVDTDRCNIKLIRNRILTDSAKTSRYITRTIPLASAADQLDIFFDINRPSSACDIEVYGQFDNGSWTAVPRVSPLTLPTNSNPDEFSEVHYTLAPASLFTEFKVKIVFKSANIVDVPRVKNLRAIASLH